MERYAAVARDAMRRILQPVIGRSANLTANAAPAAEILLAAAIGFVLLLICFALFTPLPTPNRLPAAQAQNPAAAAPGVAGNPFRSAESGSAPAILDENPAFAETSLDLVLHGTWVDEDGGAAIIKTPDGRQERFSVGDEIWNGVRLDRVFRDQVVIVTGGVRESLRLINRQAPVKPASAPSPSAAAPAIVLGDVVRLVPSVNAGNLKVILEPGADRRRFAALGLRSGDVLIAVDNRRIGPEIASEVQKLQALAGRSVISVVVEREGIALPLDISLAAQMDEEPDEG